MGNFFFYGAEIVQRRRVNDRVRESERPKKNEEVFFFLMKKVEKVNELGVCIL